jgi:hypothetical protein
LIVPSHGEGVEFQFSTAWEALRTTDVAADLQRLSSFLSSGVEKVAKRVQCGEPGLDNIGLMKEFTAGKTVGLKAKQSLIGTIVASAKKRPSDFLACC